MHTILVMLLDRMDSADFSETDIIDWGSPVPSFGDSQRARVATLGINPSNREFVNGSGEELDGPSRRFHTLNSLALNSWAEADARHLGLIIRTCREYFKRNPYDQWFKRLDELVVGASASFYDEFSTACHLDLIPYATVQKWTSLKPGQRRKLLRSNGDALGQLLRDSSIEVLILNGRSVVEQFQAISSGYLEAMEMPEWSLPRRVGPAVVGVSYEGKTDEVGGVDLGREVQVLGFNHNIQSSFGVTTKVIHAIRDWISESVIGARNAS